MKFSTLILACIIIVLQHLHYTYTDATQHLHYSYELRRSVMVVQPLARDWGANIYQYWEKGEIVLRCGRTDVRTKNE